MKRNSLSETGLSLSQAQSISNLCHQECRDIDSKLKVYNNASKTLTLNGELYVETQGHTIDNEKVIELLTKKGQLHSTQAFLMENIKSKNEELERLKNLQFIHDLKEPHYFDPLYPDLLEYVGEDWGWEQLSPQEYNEYLEVEAYASHYGQFIHKGGKLDKLRNELPNLSTLEWVDIQDGTKTPLKVEIHHTVDQLGELHNNIASLHRQYEQRVNYYKAKVKNLVTNENARIAKYNALEEERVQGISDKQWLEFKEEKAKFNSEVSILRSEFENNRQEQISEVANLRIKVDERFKPVIDKFLKEI
jgi:hypothetical protein